jgi:acyl-CoA reductase-like NAD-dependent aldehyde dehydrogenase
MTIPQLMPWIGGATKFDAQFSALVCPIDDKVESEIMESDAKVIDAAVKHAHAAFLKHRDASVAKRVEWLSSAADAIDKIEGELVHSLIRCVGKPPSSRISGAKCSRSTPPPPVPAASASPRACPMGWLRR